MIKQLIILLCISFNALAWDVIFINNTDGELVVNFNYAGGGVCAPNSSVVAKGDSVKFNAGICCGEGYNVRKTSGSGVGKTFGSGVSGNTCVNHKITVTNLSDGTLTPSHRTFYY